MSASCPLDGLSLASCLAGQQAVWLDSLSVACGVPLLSGSVRKLSVGRLVAGILVPSVSTSSGCFSPLAACPQCVRQLWLLVPNVPAAFFLSLSLASLSVSGGARVGKWPTAWPPHFSIG